MAERIRLGIGIFIISMLQKPAQEHGIGYAAPEDYQSMTELVMKYVAEQTDKTPAQSPCSRMTCGKIKLTRRMAKAMENAKPYRQYLA